MSKPAAGKPAIANPTKARCRLDVLLPGWANQASALPHPAPLLEAVEMALCRMLCAEIPHYRQLPGAQCLWRHVHVATRMPDHLVCASPVHVVAGSDDAQLVPVGRMALSKDETERMVAELNAALGGDHRAFLHDANGHWYHRGLPAEALDAAPPTAVEGHPMTLALPRSDEARPWRSLWSETQMVLHGSAVNQERQARGEPIINSVWFWGGGSLSQLTAGLNDAVDSGSSCRTSRQICLVTDDAFACGLADALGVTRWPMEHADHIDFSSPEFRRYLVLDTSLMHGNPDFIEQRDLGSQWGERITGWVNGSNRLDAELSGLTGCRELFVARQSRPAAFFSRLSAVFKS